MTQNAITPGQQKSIIQLAEGATEQVLERLGLKKDEAQQLLMRGGEFKDELARVLGPIVQRFSMAPNIVVVPDMTAVELTALAKRDLKLTYLDRDYERWDCHVGNDSEPIPGRGLKLEALVVQKKDIEPSDDDVSSEAVRAYFRDRGFTGHAAAFTQWRRQHPELMGYHASIPDDNACWRCSDGDLCVPCSDFDDEYRELSQAWIGFDWRAGWSFVGFRVVS